MSNSVWPYGLQPLQAPLSMEFFRQEYCSGLPSPSPGDFPTQGSNSHLPPARFFTIWSTRASFFNSLFRENNSEDEKLDPLTVVRGGEVHNIVRFISRRLVKFPQEMGETNIDPLEKEIATHSSTLAWTIPWTEETGRLHTVHRVKKNQTRPCDFHFWQEGEE